MKKLVSALLCAVLLAASVTGCGSKDQPDSSSDPGNSSVSASGESSAQEDTKPVEIRITRPLYFGDVSDYPDLKKEWPEMMEEKYGVKFVINALPRNEYTQKINLLMTSKDIDGLVGLFGTSEILMYKDQGVIETLDGYLADNDVWKSMPQEMQDQYIFSGELWGLPAGFTTNLFTRTIRKDWLDSLNMPVPTTVDELYEVSKAFTFNDPDGNGQNDTYGITASGTWNLQDIFMAFDARLGASGDGSITYDPNENCWVDSMLKPEMAECLTFLNKMYGEGILDKELFTNKGSNMREKFWAGEYGSTFYWLGFSGESDPYLKKITPDVEFAEIPFLKGKATSKTNYVWYGTIPYVMVKGTEGAGDMINKFVNLALGDQASHFDIAYGIEGKTYRVEDKTVYTLVDEIAGTPMPFSSLTSSIPKFYDDWNFLTDGLSDEDQKTASDLLAFKKSVAKQGMESGGLYSVSESTMTPMSDTYLAVKADILAAFETAVSSAVTGSSSVGDAIAKYISEVKNLGAQDVLDEANDFCGFTGTMTY